MHEAKISFEYSHKICVCYAKIVIDGMSISLIEENSNKASSSKNNLSHSETEIDKPDLNLEKFIDMFKKLSIETNLSSSDSESTGSDWYDLDLKKPERNASILQKKRLFFLAKNIIEISQLELNATFVVEEQRIVTIVNTIIKTINKITTNYDFLRNQLDHLIETGSVVLLISEQFADPSVLTSNSPQRSSGSSFRSFGSSLDPSSGSSQLSFSNIILTIRNHFKILFDKIMTDNNYSLDDICNMVFVEIRSLGMGKISKETIKNFYYNNGDFRDNTLNKIGAWIDKKVLSIADEVRRCKTTEQLIEFLGKQDLGLDNDNFKIIHEQKIKGQNFLSLNVDKLMQDGLKREPAKTITEFIEKIKGEEQKQQLQGEEKSLEDSGDPSSELVDKIEDWSYGNASYIFAYYAIGVQVTLVILYKPKNKKRKLNICSEKIAKFDLGHLLDRIRIMNFLQNICCLLPLIVNLCPLRESPEFQTIFRPSETVIELGYTIKKKIADERQVTHLKEIYEMLSTNNIRFSDKLEYSSIHSVNLVPHREQQEFSESDHASKMLNKKHDFKVDIWGVGNLIGSCNVTGISSELSSFSTDLCKSNPNRRPTASVALDRVKDMFRKISELRKKYADLESENTKLKQDKEEVEARFLNLK
ncbi:14459_t:CDS:2 [Cetraspora pellucida]|uniref:14459_t:CDS:1 n=1 Tax=Cetraspora pellucida TaxID=1433469 RepID=A0A9N9GPW3_9GLOM|nr:14459_t:CDS:2 [Cetraspora pellucida]